MDNINRNKALGITAKDSLRLKDLPARLGGTNEAPTLSRQECCTEA